jgi:hypothetical protein
VDYSNRYQVDSEVSFQKLEDATVIVHLGSGRIHHTNATGSRIWELLCEGRSLQETLASLHEEFDVSEEQLRGELEQFVEQLSAEKMILPKVEST